MQRTELSRRSNREQRLAAVTPGACVRFPANGSVPETVELVVETANQISR